RADVTNADSFVFGVAKLARFAPEIIKELYCIALAVPREDREWAKLVMEAPVEEGGFTDEEGIKVLTTFVDQNADAIRDLFLPDGPLRSLGATISSKFGLTTDASTAQQPPSSKRSKHTRPRTPRR